LWRRETLALSEAELLFPAHGNGPHRLNSRFSLS
jgi:hypothetical protein